MDFIGRESDEEDRTKRGSDEEDRTRIGRLATDSLLYLDRFLTLTPGGASGIAKPK